MERSLKRLWSRFALLAVIAPIAVVRVASAQDDAGPHAAIDLPTGTAPVSGTLDVAGWAIDTSAATGTGVDRVVVAIDGQILEDAQYGVQRTDIAAAYGPRFELSGWSVSLDIESLAAAGQHVLEARAHSMATDAWSAQSRIIQVDAAARFGVDFHPMSFGVDKAAQDLDRIRANSLSTVRFDVNWDSLEPSSKGVFNEAYVAKLDTVLGLIRARGLHPILTILRTPAWARTGGSGMSPPNQPADYADAVGFLAARYAWLPGMTYEIWNEPNSPVFWDAPTFQDPAGYTALLRMAYARIKSVAPNATVLGGSLVFNDPGYLEGMYADGAMGAFDGLALHPYSRGYAPDDVSVPTRSFKLALMQAEGVLAEHGEGALPIWITEMGWSTDQVPDTVRAQYFRQVVQMIRADPQIAGFCAFELNQGDDSTAPVNGLVASDGSPTASWNAYQQAVLGL